MRVPEVELPVLPMPGRVCQRERKESEDEASVRWSIPGGALLAPLRLLFLICGFGESRTGVPCIGTAVAVPEGCGASLSAAAAAGSKPAVISSILRVH
jgi:hypothetical protein